MADQPVPDHAVAALDIHDRLARLMSNIIATVPSLAGLSGAMASLRTDIATLKERLAPPTTAQALAGAPPQPPGGQQAPSLLAPMRAADGGQTFAAKVE